MTFTPGPWSYDGKYTVGIPHKDGDTYFRTNPEDARLIAVAPDLHYVAVLVTEVAHILGEKNAIVNLARKAVAKVRGES